jgi:hypothetical protein
MVRVSECQIPNGCIYDEGAGACPLCDEDGADRLAEYYADLENDVTGERIAPKIAEENAI